MADLVETLTNVGDTIKSGVQGLKNLAAPEAPGGSPIPPQPGPGGIRYNRDGSPPTPQVEAIQVGKSVKKEAF
jgi:hypothetical protein